MTRVVWSENEREMVYNAARDLGPPERGDTQEVWQKAQLCLDKSRRRPFDPSAAALMNKERKKGRVNKHTVMPAVEVPPKPEPAPEPDAVAPIPEVALPEAPPEPLPGFDQTVVDFLLRVLYNPDLREALRSVVRDTLAPESEEVQRTSLTWRQPLPGRVAPLRIVIVGGGGNMHSELKAPQGVELRYYMGLGEHTYRLRAMLKYADVAIVITRLINHGAMQMVKHWEANGKKKALYWTRSTSELKPVIEEMATQHKAQEGGQL